MNSINANVFQAMVTNGLKNLKANYQKINDLNVFPVPDGDTGTNMTATLKGGVEAMEKEKEETVSAKSAALASGMLLSARGNSGVILSQFFAGLAKGLDGLKEVNPTQFAIALQQATHTAYEAVVTPVEGTILTVAREGSDAVENKIEKLATIEELFSMLHLAMGQALKKTPDLLPVLKEAGVIDSGGAGLLTVIDGMSKEINGEEVEDSAFDGPSSGTTTTDLSAFNEDSVLTYGYCTEFILQLQNCKNGPKEFDLQAMIDHFKSFGDSIVALRSGNIVKVHVHTKDPSLPIIYAQKYGEFLTFKMENMNLQHNEILLKEMPLEEKKKKKYAVVAVSPSAEISSLFRELKVDAIVSGGQSMNPSADDFIKAFDDACAENIIVFPNNGNVILTAKQAASLYQKANVVVISSKSVVQAYSALQLIDFESEGLDGTIETINGAIESVVAGEVSTAVRDSVNNGISVTCGDYIGILSGSLVSDNSDPILCLMETLSKVEDIEDRSVITVFFGKNVTPEQKEAVGEAIEKKYPLMDFFPIEGGQDVYPFIFALE